MQHAFQIIEGTPNPGLPILATANDVRELVQLLKKRPEGITVAEASDATRRRLFDPRKVAAYELWGIISKSGDRIKLSRLGSEFASRLEPEAQLYRVLLDNTPPYRALLEWIHRQQLELVTHADIVGYWQDHFPGALQSGERTAEGHVISFLQVCHAAEIGVATVGRKGQPSRPRLAASPRLRVFVSAPKGAAAADRVRDALQMADIASEVVEREAGVGELIPERTCEAMRRCEAGVIILGRADCEAGAVDGTALRPGTLVEIGAACVHYARRLVILREPGMGLPFDLGGFCQYELDGDELTWETGLQLVKAVKRFSSDLKEMS